MSASADPQRSLGTTELPPELQALFGFVQTV